MNEENGEVIFVGCENCLYFYERIVDYGVRRGECRRFPPQDTSPGEYVRWPYTEGDGWCGEYKRLEE